MNDWKVIEEWLYSHGYFDASSNMRDIKSNRKAGELLRECHMYDLLMTRKTINQKMC